MKRLGLCKVEAPLVGVTGATHTCRDFEPRSQRVKIRQCKNCKYWDSFTELVGSINIREAVG